MYLILKYFSNISFSHFFMIYRCNIGFFLICFFLYFKQTVILTFIFDIMVDKGKWISGSSFHYFGSKQVMWRYTLFLSTLPTRQDNFTRFSADDWIFSYYVIWIIDDIKCAIFVALMTVVLEIVIAKSGICTW